MEAYIIGFIVGVVADIIFDCTFNIWRKKWSKVHFYVARDKYQDKLYVFLEKPVRGIEAWHSCVNGVLLFDVSYFKTYGLKLKDFQNLKWEDEPVEVFLKLNY